jgi:hypothetical protein
LPLAGSIFQAVKVQTQSVLNGFERKVNKSEYLVINRSEGMSHGSPTNDLKNGELR